MAPEDLEKNGLEEEEVEQVKEVSEENWRDLQLRIRELLKPQEKDLLKTFEDYLEKRKIKRNKGNGEMVYVNHALKSVIYNVSQIFYSSSIKTFFPNEESTRKSTDELLRTEDGKKVKEAILYGVYFIVINALARKRAQENAEKLGYLGAEVDVELKGEVENHLEPDKRIKKSLEKYLRILQFMASTGLQSEGPMEYDYKVKKTYEQLLETGIADESKLEKVLIYLLENKDEILSAILKYTYGGEEQFKEKCKEILHTSLKEDFDATLKNLREYQNEYIEERVVTDEEMSDLQEEIEDFKKRIQSGRKRQETQKGLPALEKPQVRKRQETQPLFGALQAGEINVPSQEVSEDSDQEPLLVTEDISIRSEIPVEYSMDSSLLRTAEEFQKEDNEFGEETEEKWQMLPSSVSEEIDPFDVSSDSEVAQLPHPESLELEVEEELPEGAVEIAPGLIEFDEDPKDTDELLPKPVPIVEDIEEEEEEPKTPSKIMEWLRKRKLIVSLITVGVVGISAIGYGTYKGCGPDDTKGKKPVAGKKLAHKKGVDAGVRTFHDIKKDLDAGIAVKMDAASKAIQDAESPTKDVDAHVPKQPIKVATKSPIKSPTKAPALTQVKSTVKHEAGLMNIDSGSLDDLPEGDYRGMFNGEPVPVEDMPGGIVSRYMEENLLKGASRAEKRAYKKYLKKLEKGWLMYMKHLEIEVQDKINRGLHNQISEKDMAEYEWFTNVYAKSHKKRYRQAGWLYKNYQKLKDKKSGKAKWYKKIFKMGKDFMEGLHKLNPHIKSVNDVKPGQKVWFSKKVGKVLQVLKTLWKWAESMGKKVPKESNSTTGEIQVDNPEFMYAAQETVHEPSVQIDSDYIKDLQAKKDSNILSGSFDMDLSKSLNASKDGPLPPTPKTIIDDKYFVDLRKENQKIESSISASGEVNNDTAESLVKNIVNDIRNEIDIDNYYAEYEIEKPEEEVKVEDYYAEYEIEEESPYLEYKVEKIQEKDDIDDYYDEYEIEKPEEEVKVEDYYAEYEVEKEESVPEPASKGLWGRFKNKAKSFFSRKAA